MRLLIALPDRMTADEIRMDMELHGWQVQLTYSGSEVPLCAASCDLLLLHACLPGLDGQTAGNALAQSAPICPPRVLFICPPELYRTRPAWADCTVPAGTSAHHLCALMNILAKKPLPRLAAAHRQSVVTAVEGFLNEVAMDARFKGRAYAAWLLQRMVPSTVVADQSMQTLYAACAQAFRATPASVERCLRVAVENVFTRGNLRGIEHFFGESIDPERGKPTNRAFLQLAAQRLRAQANHSFTAARSPNSIEMHHKPAAPTRV